MDPKSWPLKLLLRSLFATHTSSPMSAPSFKSSHWISVWTVVARCSVSEVAILMEVVGSGLESSSSSSGMTTDPTFGALSMGGTFFNLAGSNGRSVGVARAPFTAATTA